MPLVPLLRGQTRARLGVSCIVSYTHDDCRLSTLESPARVGAHLFEWRVRSETVREFFPLAERVTFFAPKQRLARAIQTSREPLPLCRDDIRPSPRMTERI